MRTQITIVVVAFGIGLGVGCLLPLFGFGSPKLGVAVALTIGVILSVCILMGYDAMSNSIQEVVKQIAVWLGVVVLLPLTVWYGTSAVSPPPDWKEFSRSTARLEEKIREATAASEKEQLRQEKDRQQDVLDEAERVYYRAMFWVAYPIGLVAIIVGIFFPVQSVGGGLMFGGLNSLTAGCYSYWDKMEGGERFGSLVVALIVLLVLGTWRFRAKTLDTEQSLRDDSLAAQPPVIRQSADQGTRSLP
ncbi:hypothetical protein AYO44_05890 [Planctomycetaceae bacterium SCGC AG-212-F19]|nr:hypothetical protein AYO44_05890 [Planctomycetaceae bacterium SCGC AG-212-F19]